MSEEFNIFIEKDADSYYVAMVPGLEACYTQAKSSEALACEGTLR